MKPGILLIGAFLLFVFGLVACGNGIGNGSPRTVASGLSTPYNIAVNDTDVYWTEYGTGYLGNVKKIKKNNGSITTLASDMCAPFGIALDSSNVYFTTANCGSPAGAPLSSTIAGVYKVALNSGPTITLASDGYLTWGVIVDSDNVYWQGGASGANYIKKVLINNGTVTTIATNPDIGPYGIAVDETAVYWLSTGYTGTYAVPGAVWKQLKSESTATTIAVEQGLSVRYMMIDSSDVYFATSEYTGTGYNGSIRKVSKNGGQVTILASNIDNPSGIALDSTNIYWTASYGGVIQTTLKSGGAVTTLASGRTMPGSVAVDSTSVYWIEGNSIKKIAK